MRQQGFQSSSGLADTELKLLMCFQKLLNAGIVLERKFISGAWQQLCLAWSAAQALADKVAPGAFAIFEPSGSFWGETSEGPDFIMM